jgi:spore coat polysaccharide biosynthesis predicted glycosyltransferase SpsG
VVRNAANIAEHMAAADLVFTSAGRTTYEVASLGVPCIVLAQNARELTHFFASAENGFRHLGLGMDCSKQAILAAFAALADDASARRASAERMRRTDLRGGRSRVHALLARVIEAQPRRARPGDPA